MKKLFLFVGAVVCTLGVSAQVLSDKDLQEIKGSVKMDSYTKAMQNALSANGIDKLAKNLEDVNVVDHNFTYRVKVKGITNQRSSGRCWLFASLNMFRYKAMDIFNVDEFEFSEIYLSFWDLFEKSNLFLNNMIETANLPIDDRKVQYFIGSPIGDGGVWSCFAGLVDKYGMVPQYAMPETHSSENTNDMRKFINLKLKEDGLRLRQACAKGAKAKELQGMRVEMMKEVYRMLVLNLGTPPESFEWRYKDKDGKVSEYKTYTPAEFRDKILGDVKLSDYVMLMNDPSRPYNVHYEIENYRAVQEGANWNYVNLPSDEMKKMVIEALKDNEAVYSSCDVGKQLDRAYGILDVNNFDYESVYGVKFGMDKAERIQTKASGSSHGMALIAVDLDKNGKPVKWQFENSWGSSAGHNGYLTFTDKWFDEYMFRIAIPKKYVTPEVLKINDGKATMLPVWDWMN